MRFFLFVPVLALALTATGCEKNNDLIAQKQIADSQQACPRGCEQPPPQCRIKGNVSAEGNKFFHVPGGVYYDGIEIQTDKGERWFCTEQEAVDNGWTKSFQ